ncbi:MAG TPA: carboxypeptidase-like regulatory domain-containing protein [Vicinamibacterales bacterium]|nr:carboxypeptidase-like regulatory domain-containing protein [Vicinamibacterales bacterium]
MSCLLLLVAFSLFAPLNLLGAHREETECIAFPTMVTSALRIQVYAFGSLPVEALAAAGADVIVYRSGTRTQIRSNKTDDRGYVAFPDLPPGDYALHIRVGGETTSQDVRLVTREMAPRRTIAVALGSGWQCGSRCVVEASGRLTQPPSCLFPTVAPVTQQP